jgi:hypothetical protein
MQINFTKSAPVEKPTKPTLPAAMPQTPKAVPNAEELTAAAKNAAATLFGDPVTDIAPAATPPPSPAPAAPAAPAPEPEPEPEPEPQNLINTEDLIRRTARETADEIQRREPAPPQPAPSTETPFELTPEDEQEHRVLLFLEGQDQKHAGKADAWIAYCKLAYAYQDQWEKDNPGKEFDPQDEEHTPWFDAHPPPHEKSVIEQGTIDMRVEEKFQQRVKPELDTIKAREALEKSAPVIVDNVTKKVVQLVRVASTELATIVTNADGSANLTDATIARAHEVDPIAGAIIDLTIKEVEPLFMALEKSVVRDENGEYPFRLTPAKNKVHAILNQFTNTAEENMRKAPPEAQVKDGRQWISIQRKVDAQNELQNRFNKRQITKAQLDQQIADLENRYWILTVDDVADLVIDDYGKRAKQLITQSDDLAKKKYGPKTAATNGAQPQAAATRQIAPQAARKPNPPSLSSSSDVLTTRPAGTTPQKTAAQQAADVMFK